MPHEGGGGASTPQPIPTPAPTRARRRPAVAAAVPPPESRPAVICRPGISSRARSKSVLDGSRGCPGGSGGGGRCPGGQPVPSRPVPIPAARRPPPPSDTRASPRSRGRVSHVPGDAFRSLPVTVSSRNAAREGGVGVNAPAPDPDPDPAADARCCGRRAPISPRGSRAVRGATHSSDHCGCATIAPRLGFDRA